MSYTRTTAVSESGVSEWRGKDKEKESVCISKYILSPFRVSESSSSGYARTIRFFAIITDRYRRFGRSREKKITTAHGNTII